MKYPLARTFCALLILTCVASGAHAGIQSRQSLDDFSPLFAPLDRGAKFRLDRIAVGDREQTLELERFEVWAPNARIDVVGEGGTITHIAPPNVRYFRGSVVGEPDSLVFLSTGAEQGVAGMIFSNDRRYAVGSTPGEVRRGSRMQRDVVINEMDVIDDYETGAGFECGVEGKTMTPPRTASTLRENAMLPIEPNGALSGTGLWSMNLAIDTDFELYGDMDRAPPTSRRSSATSSALRPPSTSAICAPSCSSRTAACTRPPPILSTSFREAAVSGTA